MKLRALLASVLLTVGCASTQAVEIVPSPTPKVSKPPKKRRPHTTPKPKKPARGLWYRLADCESGDRDRQGEPIAGTARWGLHNPPYEGGLQWLPSTWRLAGGTKYAASARFATPEQQIAVAKAWLARTSWGQWPTCSRIVGAR